MLRLVALKIILLAVTAVLFSCFNNGNKNNQSEIDSVLSAQQTLADSFYYAGQLDSAKELYLVAARYAMQQGSDYFDKLSDNLVSAGYCCYEADRYSEAIEFYNDALKYSESTNNLPSIATIYCNLGIAQMLKSDYISALESFLAALKIDEQIYNIEVISTDYNNLGKLYDAWKNYELAEQYYRKALEVDIANGDSLKIPIRLNSLGMLFKQQSMHDSALIYLKEALFIDEKLNNQKSAAIRKSNIGQILCEIGNYNEAEKFLLQALEYFEQKNIEKSITITQNCLGDVYFHKKDYKKTSDLYQNSLSLSKRINYPVLIIENYKDLAYLSEKTGDFANAFKNFEKSKILGDSLFTSDNQKIMNEYHIKYETEIKEKKLQEQMLALQKSNFRIIIIAIIGFIFLILSIILFRLIRFKRRTSKVLEAKNMELAHSNSTKDKLFSIIAHDLKNNVSGIFNLSSAINQNFDLISNNELKNYLCRLEQASINMRALLLNLLQWAMGQNNTIKIKPVEIDSLELLNSVAGQLKGQAGAKNIEIKIDSAKFSFISDKQMLNTILYNLIGNAVKFSFTGNCVDVYSRYDSGKIKFVIQDHGIGLGAEDIGKLFKIDIDSRTIGNSSEKGTGLGLILCNDLLRHLNGAIFVESAINQGSKFVFEIPEITNE